MTDMVTPTRLYRRRRGIVGGVAGGLSDHLGVGVFAVRVAIVVLAVLAGAGVLAYALLWSFAPLGTVVEQADSRTRRQAWGLTLLGVVCGAAVAGLSLGARWSQLLVPLIVVALGLALLWHEVAGTRRRGAWLRLGLGAAAIIGGLAVIVVFGNRQFGGVSTTIVAVIATVIAVVLLTTPLWVKMLADLNAERGARIRTAEREEIAAHLHDSVLQTLALIQQASVSPAQVQRLARRQERELRRWLFDDGAAPGDADLTVLGELRSIVEDVEANYDTEVDLVTVGEVTPAQLSERRRVALMGATREAVVNAAKHSGVPRVDVYLEVEPREVEIFVRDRGKGFVLEEVPDDRRGVSRSITDRVQRHGGTVGIVTAPEHGTEVRLTMPLEAADSEPNTEVTDGDTAGKEHQ